MKVKVYPAYYVLGSMFLILIIFGFIMDTPKAIGEGIINIILQSDILITDYLVVGGIGAAFVNAGLVGLLSIVLLIIVGIKPNGSTIMALWLMAGFSFFGKNILNIWPVMFGVWLYSRYQKEPFLNFTLIALLGTTLSPAVSQLRFTGHFGLGISILFGILIGIGVGFILPPLTSYCMKLHQGYNLYNTGFSAGLLATLLMSVFRALGINFEKRLIWYTGSNSLFAVLLICIFTSLLITGYLMNSSSFKGLGKIYASQGRLVSDFYILYGNSIYINMGILGIFFTLYLYLIKGDFNGPTMGAIFTIAGFGSFGKHLGNVIPVIAGAILSSLLNIWAINSPEMILSTLFSTTLAPISGHFGWPYGVLAGFVHVCVVMNTGYLHGGLNLYNNGLAGGIVAIILVPIINAFRKEPTNEAHKSKEYKNH
jgi:hypothetical protein